MAGNGRLAARLHEPTLREVTTELEAFEEVALTKIEALKDKVADNDRLYGERDVHRVQNVTDAFAASEKAIAKSDQAQDTYNRTHNDLLRQMADQRKEFISQKEADDKFSAIDQRLEEQRKAAQQDKEQLLRAIQDLREGPAPYARQVEQSGENRTRTSLAIWAMALSAGATVVAVVAVILIAVFTHK
jgi:hypothetical protein